MRLRRLSQRAATFVAIGCLALAGCGGSGLNPTPEKLDGSQSQEFEQDDLDRAEEAPSEVKDYCSGATSEAQRLGCESHVDPEDIP